MTRSAPESEQEVHARERKREQKRARYGCYEVEFSPKRSTHLPTQFVHVVSQLRDAPRAGVCAVTKAREQSDSDGSDATTSAYRERDNEAKQQEQHSARNDNDVEREDDKGRQRQLIHYLCIKSGFGPPHERGHRT